jgi:hypothetical protein
MAVLTTSLPSEPVSVDIASLCNLTLYLHARMMGWESSSAHLGCTLPWSCSKTTAVRSNDEKKVYKAYKERLQRSSLLQILGWELGTEPGVFADKRTSVTITHRREHSVVQWKL